jgi:tetratricopeptide (TPR) repeat protein
MEATNSLWGMSLAKSYLSYFSYLWEGKVSLAFQTGDEAVRLAEESGDIYSQAIAYTAQGGACYGKGFLKEAIENLSKAVEYCERINLFIHEGVARHRLGEVFYEIGDYQSSKENFSRTVYIVDQSRSYSSSWLATAKIGLEMAKAKLNGGDIDLVTLYAYVQKNRLRMFEGWQRRFISELLLNMDDQHLPEAEEWTKEAIKAHRRNGVMWGLARSYLLYAELFKRKGDQMGVRKNLTKAIEIFKECGADGWVKKTKKELASFS